MRGYRHFTAKLAAAAVLTIPCASAYFHYLHYVNPNGTFVALPEKFDLNGLTNKTVPYFVSQAQQNLTLAPGDTFNGVLSQIQAAARVWNSVPSSQLRLQYGGLDKGTVTADCRDHLSLCSASDINGTSGSSPSIEVLFDEVPPGLVAMGAPVIKATANSSFVPILKSVVILNSDLSDTPSYGEAFFGTIVHELGHTLGLQHTLASAAMSTGVTRSTSRSKPLTSDDIAGISLLYPTKTFASRTGSISGTVADGSRGIHLASVVAIPANGSAVAAMTLPDGSFKIDGLAPGDYYVYASPLPPALQGEITPANLNFPVDSDGKAVGPTENFSTMFYPGTTDPSKAQTVSVSAGGVLSNLSLSVTRRGSVTIHSITTYSYPGGFPMHPAYVNSTMQYPSLVASGTGITNDSGKVPGLSVQVLGGGALGVRNYPGYPSYVVIDIDPATLKDTSPTPRHLVFSANGDSYVLPSGYFQVHDAPPLIVSADATPDPVLGQIYTIRGSGVTPSSRVLFDGVDGSSLGTDDFGHVVFSAPTAPKGYVANVIAVNADGQSSSFAQGDTVPTATLDGPDASTTSAAVNPGSMPAGVETVVEVDSTNIPFAAGTPISLSFGSSDIAVRDLWIADTNKLYANIAVAPGASLNQMPVVIGSGLLNVTVPNAVQISPTNPDALAIDSGLVNSATGQAYIYAGVSATARITSTIADGTAVSVFLNNQLIANPTVSSNQVTFVVPDSQKTGTATLRIDNGKAQGVPVLINVNGAPPQIAGFDGASNAAGTPAKTGDSMTVLITGAGDPKTTKLTTDQVLVNVAGIDVVPSAVDTTDSGFKVTFTVPPGIPANAQVQLSVTVNGAPSAPVVANIVP